VKVVFPESVVGINGSQYDHGAVFHFPRGKQFNNILLRIDTIHGNDLMYISNFLVENILHVLSINLITLVRGRIL
jgi:hypothetical protein